MTTRRALAVALLTMVSITGVPAGWAFAADAGSGNAPGTGFVRTDRLGDPLPRGAIFRMGTVRLRHGGDGAIRCLAFSPDGSKLASGGDDRTIRVWQAATGKELQRLPAGEGPCLAVAFAPDGATLASLGQDKTIRLWDAGSGKEQRRWQTELSGTAVALAFAPDGQTLALADGSKTIRMWDTATGTERRSLAGHQGGTRCLAYSPDGGKLASGGDDRTVRLWDTGNGEQAAELAGHQAGVRAVVFLPGGKAIASRDETGATAIWDIATRRRSHHCDGPEGGLPLGVCDSGKVVAAFDGKARRIYRFEVATGKTSRRIVPIRPATVEAAAFSPDGKVLAVAVERTICLRDTATGRDLVPLEDHANVAVQVAFGLQGKFLRAAFPTAVRSWGMATGRPHQRFEGTYRRVTALAPDGRTIASAYSGDSIEIWALETGRIRSYYGRRFPSRVLQGPKGGASMLALSKDGAVLAAAGPGDPAIHLSETATSRPFPPVQGEQVRAFCLAFSPDSKSLAVADGVAVRVRDIASGDESFQLAGHAKQVQAIAFSPDGKLLATGDAAGEVRLWQAATGKEVTRFQLPQPLRGGVYCLAFTPDAKRLACGGGDAGKGGPDFPVFLCDAATGKVIRELRGHQGAVASAAISPDGELLAIGTEDGTVLVWDLSGRLWGPPRGADALTPQRLEELWADLAKESPAVAYGAVAALLGAPEAAVAFLNKHLPPAAPVDAARVAQLVADLASDDDTVRDRATRDLESLGGAALTALFKALEGELSDVTQRRVERLVRLAKSASLSPATLRTIRAVEVLERIGTPAARTRLETLAGGDGGAWPTREAKAALGRLSGRTRAFP